MGKFIGLVVKVEQGNKRSGSVSESIEVEENKSSGKKTAAKSSPGVKKE